MITRISAAGLATLMLIFPSQPLGAIQKPKAAPSVLRVYGMFEGCEAVPPRRLRLVYVKRQRGADVVNTYVTASLPSIYGMKLTGGRYGISLTDEHCAATFDVVLLGGRLRDINVRFAKATSPGEVDVYELPGASLVIPDLQGRSIYLVSPKGAVVPKISNGVAYFDYVPSGTYGVRVSGQNWDHHQAILTIPGDHKVHVYKINTLGVIEVVK